MIGREYEEYLQRTASTKQRYFDFRLWLSVTAIGFVLPLVGFFLKG